MVFRGDNIHRSDWMMRKRGISVYSGVISKMKKCYIGLSWVSVKRPIWRVFFNIVKIRDQLTDAGDKIQEVAVFPYKHLSKNDSYGHTLDNNVIRQCHLQSFRRNRDISQIKINDFEWIGRYAYVEILHHVHLGCVDVSATYSFVVTVQILSHFIAEQNTVWFTVSI